MLDMFARVRTSRTSDRTSEWLAERPFEVSCLWVRCPSSNQVGTETCHLFCAFPLIKCVVLRQCMATCHQLPACIVCFLFACCVARPHGNVRHYHFACCVERPHGNVRPYHLLCAHGNVRHRHLQVDTFVSRFKR